MTQELPGRCRALLASQEGMVANWQLTSAGVSPSTVRNLVRYGRWRRVNRGVYAAFTGTPGRRAQLWAAVLRAGPAAMLSHESAAEVYGLAARLGRLIHVTVPATQRVQPTPGIVVHRSRRIEQIRFPGTLPPCTLIDETVLDLVERSRDFDDAFSWLSRACQQGLTSPGMLRLRMEMRNRLRWRRELSEALGDVQEGVHSTLERRYVRGVERPHALPRARRQAPVLHGGRRRYLDQLYDDYGLCVELDGQAAHPAEERWRDISRDNRNATAGIQTLRFGWRDVARPCETALIVARVLELRGWTGDVRACGPSCSLPRLAGQSVWKVTSGARR
jgi:very-short-patch-repair endonuclease